MTALSRFLAILFLSCILYLPQLEAKSLETRISPTTATIDSPRVTFIEIGSVKCIPCKKMQPVMKAIEIKYKGLVKVVFHDVWTEEGKPAATKYNIQLIPTQVFLDENGKEFHRHEGFYPEAEIDELLHDRIQTHRK